MVPNRLPKLNEFLVNRLTGTIISECVILAKRDDSGVILAKNRDRKYLPHVSIYREYAEDKDLEIVYIYDFDTGWMEGMNSAGIGIINSTLMVGRDENEKQIVQTTGKKSKDGRRILNALKYDTIEEVIDSLVNYKKGVKGHTIVSDGVDIYTIESTSKNDAIVTKRDNDNYVVRTNHGNELTNAGYTEGNDYMSSVLRKSQMTKNIKSGGDIYDILSSSKLDKKDPNNVVRDTDHMTTTSQMYMDLENLKFSFKPLKDKIKFTGVVNKTPENYENKITIDLIK